MKSHCRILAAFMAILALAAFATTREQGYSYSKANQSLTTLTDQGVGPIVLGANVGGLPRQLEGLYDRKLYINPPKEIKENWYRGWEFYDTDGNVVAQAIVDEQVPSAAASCIACIAL